MSEETIPPEYQHQCPTCGKYIDRRDLGQVMSHGRWNAELQRHECLDEEIVLPGITAKKVGESVEWKDGKPTHLN